MINLETGSLHLLPEPADADHESHQGSTICLPAKLVIVALFIYAGAFVYWLFFDIKSIESINELETNKTNYNNYMTP